jgi:hypothetical protein
MAFASGFLAIPLTGALLFAGGEVAGVANPEGVPLVITDAKLYVITPSTAGANLNVGIAAAITTMSQTLMNACAVNGAITGTAWHGMTALAANGAAVLWAANTFLTATGSASTVGFTGVYFVKYVRTS